MFRRRAADRAAVVRPRRCQYCGEALAAAVAGVRSRPYCGDRCEAELYVLTARSI